MQKIEQAMKECLFDKSSCEDLLRIHILFQTPQGTPPIVKWIHRVRGPAAGAGGNNDWPFGSPAPSAAYHVFWQRKKETQNTLDWR